jgi:hypothetical protein
VTPLTGGPVTTWGPRESGGGWVRADVRGWWCDGGLVGRFLFRPTWGWVGKEKRIDSCTTVRGSAVKINK